MDRDLEGRVAVVTGGGRGIGCAIALALGARGANLVIGYFRDRSAAESTCLELEGSGVKAVAIKAHVGDERQLDRMFEKVGETFGRIDMFVSNAATGVIKPFSELDSRAWNWTMDSNARALFLGASRASTLMTDGGSIIALSSLGSGRVLPGYSVVGASKAAIESLTRYLAVELAARGIRANAVSPGVVDTDALTHFPNRDEMLREARSRSATTQLVTPEDVAATVCFLCSPEAKMITGQTIVIDGGASLVA